MSHVVIRRTKTVFLFGFGTKRVLLHLLHKILHRILENIKEYWRYENVVCLKMIVNFISNSSITFLSLYFVAKLHRILLQQYVGRKVLATFHLHSSFSFLNHFSATFLYFSWKLSTKCCKFRPSYTLRVFYHLPGCHFVGSLVAPL